MEVIGKIYLDTNIFILAFENTSEISTLLGHLFTMNGNHPRFATSELTLSEILVKPYRDANDGAVDTYETLILSSEWLNVVPVGTPVLRHAALLRANYPRLKLPDAIHVSTAFAANCTRILTADGGLKDSYEIGAQSVASKPLEVLRPDELTLTSLIENLAA